MRTRLRPLFEQGYVLVDASGKIIPGRSPITKEIGEAVAALVGKFVSNYGPSSTFFKWHKANAPI